MTSRTRSVWDRDMIGDAELLLHDAGRLWAEQNLTAPTQERAAEINDLLSRAIEQLEAARAAVQNAR